MISNVTTSLPGQTSKDFLHVGVVAPWPGDGDAHLGVAESADGRDDPCAQPHKDGHAHWAGILQDASGTHKDPWSNDVS